MENEIPVRQGEIVTADCIGLGTKGDGVFKIKGFVVMAPTAVYGKRYELNITKVLPKVGFASIVREVI